MKIETLDCHKRQCLQTHRLHKQLAIEMPWFFVPFAMAESDLDELKTRHRLLARLHDWQDDQSWQEFFEKYWRLIYNLAVRAGLRADEAVNAARKVRRVGGARRALEKCGSAPRTEHVCRHGRVD